MTEPWREFADTLEHLQDRDERRRKAREGLQECLEHGDFDFVLNLLLVTQEQLPRKKRDAA